MRNSKHLPAIENPRKWRYTYESNSHIPILRLYIFNSKINPSIQCIDLKLTILFEKSLLEVTWIENDQLQSVWVPIPRVLIDADAPVGLRALDDCIEVKFVLVLPVDHPIVSNFDFEDVREKDLVVDDAQPLQLDSDITKLASSEEVHFYCRSCSTKLTQAVRVFKEMPSVNWREAADNWFGTCCCSFGGVSEKLVAKYANSYTCTSGTCLLDVTSVVICKDDFIGYKFPELSGNNSLKNTPNVSHGWEKKVLGDFDIKLNCSVTEDRDKECCDKFPDQVEGHKSLELSGNNSLKNTPNVSHGWEKEFPHDFDIKLNCSVSEDRDNECRHNHANEEKIDNTNELLANKANLLNGLLGNSFMVTSPYLSKDIKWSEISCPHCSCLLGAYPHDNIDEPLNGSPLNDGVHLFKCYISSCLPVGGPTDLFRNYTLERMFTSHLMEIANDELSFRTVVRNLQTRSPMLQIVLLNPNSWCSFGDCLDAMVPNPNVIMYPMVKVLFSDCSNATESQLRKLDEWVTKNQVGDIYMLMSKALAESLELANSMLPPSHAFLQGLSLSFLRR